VAARSHPDLLVVERTIDQKTERLRSQVRVEDARQASQFFSLSPAMGGWRVCIVDAADDLNSDSANSLLKVLEEPPARSVFLIVAHAPGRLLATIRSRSIRLDLKPLATEQVVEAMQALGAGETSSPDELAAIAALSQGSPGRAVNLVGSQGARLFLKFQEVAGEAPAVRPRPPARDRRPSAAARCGGRLPRVQRSSVGLGGGDRTRPGRWRAERAPPSPGPGRTRTSAIPFAAPMP
jgi:DNA polymerase III subunit delta'